MLFNSSEFFVLLIVTFTLYYIPKLAAYQVQLLVLSSLVFYAYEAPEWLILLLASAAINVVTSYYVVFGVPAKRKLLATMGVVCNLIILAFFKYSPLIGLTFFNNTSLGDFLLKIPLPIGISFFTFEGISLVVDVYKEKYFMEKEHQQSSSVIKHMQKTLFFISFFPHLISGPILKAHEFLPQINIKYFRNINWEFCFKNFILGFFLKMVVADNLKDFTFWIKFPYFESHSTINLLVMLFGYSCQIFADFAGYSIIALGLAKLFGYDFIQNFNFPYISTSFSEFWQRWHISLSSFLKEYLYIPLGGSRKSKGRTYLNLMITMILGGLWHGASWSYAIWGGFHGLVLAIERIINDNLKIKVKSSFFLFVKGLLVFFFVTVAWLLFKLPNFSDVISFFYALVKNRNIGMDRYKIIYPIVVYTSPVLLFHLYYLVKSHKPILYQKIKKIEPVLYAIMLFMIFTNSGSSEAFIYFQF